MGVRPTPDLQRLRVPQHAIDVGTGGDNDDVRQFEVSLNEGNVTKQSVLVSALCSGTLEYNMCGPGQQVRSAMNW